MIKETTLEYEIYVSENGTLNIRLSQINSYWKNDYTNLFTISTFHTEKIKDTRFYNNTIRFYHHRKWIKMIHI